MNEAKEELKQLLDLKKRNYAKYVKQVHEPHRSEKKAQELQLLKEKIHHPVRKSKRISPGMQV